MSQQADTELLAAAQPAVYHGPSVSLPEGALHELFHAQALRTPGAVALVCGEQRLTYAELDGASDALAHRLIGAGVRPGDVVALFQHRSLAHVVAELAVLKSGAAFLPLDARQPADRLSWMLQDTGAVLLLTDRTPEETGFAGDLPVIEVTERIATDHEPASAADVSVHPDQPVYVMYTSGSSGTPKGVVNTHRNVVELALDPCFDGGAHARVLAYSPLAFDSSTYELWVPLLRGGQAVILPGVRVDVAELATAVGRYGITAAYFTTALFDAMAAEEVGALGRLREIWTGGDVLSVTALQRVLDECPGTGVVHVYGPTESTVFCSFQEFGPGHGQVEGLNLGRPMANTSMYVLDERLRPALPGVTGELYVAGDHLARGYLGRSVLTAERFTADPYGPAGARMYRTGDLAGVNEAGEIEFRGRADQQVKLRGFRIEPGEIETVLLRHPSVAQAAVIVREDRPGDKRLVAYAVSAGAAGAGSAEERGGVDTEELRAHVAAALPEYMVPSVVVAMDALPLTANGKLDRRALPAPLITADAAGRTARNPVEEVLCGLFADALGLPDIGIDDDFFHLGGHSLLATRLVLRIREALDTALSIRDFFQRPTVARLAEQVRPGTAEARRLIPAVRDGAERVPLSSAQQRLWFLDQLEGPSATYNVPLAVRLSGPIDTEVLRQALTDVVARHAVLRTVYPVVDGDVNQHVLPADACEVPFTVVPVDEADLAEAMARATGHFFDLVVELPLNATLFAVSEQEHVLLLRIHHIAFDGWSHTPLMRDLSAAYTARAAGSAPDWEPLPVQYADYSVWQQDLLAEDGERQIEFWREALAGLPDEATLPADRPRPAAATFRGATHTVTYPADRHAALTALARRGGGSFFMVAQAATAALLSRSGAGHDIPLGSLTAGRADAALEDLVGFFVNTLVLRTDLSGDPTFRELLDRVRDADLTAWSHQDLPFDRLVEALNPERSTARHPLFQVMLSVADAVVPAPRLAGVRAETTPVTLDIAKFDLTVNFYEHHGEDGLPAGVDLVFEYATDLYEAATIRTAVDRLVRLLDAVADDPDIRIGDIQLLDARERAEAITALTVFTDTAVVSATGALHELFSAQAARTPDQVALVCGEQQVTYRALDAASDALAHRLIGLGVRPEEPVGLFLERSTEYVAASLGVLKAGAVYVPLDAKQPQERLSWMLRDTGATLVLADGPAPWAESVDGVRVLPVPTLAEALETPVLPPGVSVHPDQPVYVMYTSGSSGTPKGVVNTHRNVVELALDPCFDGGAHARVLAYSPLAFDSSTYELWVPLLRGGQAVILPVTKVDVSELAEAVRQYDVTAAYFTTALFDAMAAEEVGALGRLREIWTGGDVLSVTALQRVLDECPGTGVVHVYGPTESTVFCSFQEFGPGHGRVEGLNLGRPMANTSMYVLDERLRPALPGVTGELYVSGGHLARGYLGRSVLTAERFTADPYGPAGARMYRTGDLAGVNEAGEIEFRGRADQQVKLRGFRIEPGEIETVLLRHPSVAQAAVIVREDRPGDKQLVAYAVPAEGGALDRDGALRLVAEALPPYMVPSVMVALDALPLTANGKLDRRALPAPLVTADAAGRTARNPVEEVLCGLFADILGLRAVGIDDDFFRLGGHSILAARLVARARRALDVTLSVRDLFKYPTVALLAEYTRDGGGSAYPPLLAGQRPERVPLSSAQQRLWFLDQMEGPSATYNMPLAVRLRGELDTEALRAALLDVVERHEALRTVFPAHDGTPYQRVLPAAPGLVPLFTTEVTDEELPEVLERLSGTAFDLAGGVPLRTELLKVGPQDHVLLVVAHHIASDGWSHTLFLRDLSAAYTARAGGLAPGWEPLGIQYADYAVWQRDLLAESGERQADFWRQALAGLPAEATLPADRPRPATASFRGATHTVSCDGDLHAALTALARESGTTMLMVAQAALATLLSRSGAGTDVPIGSPVTGRPDGALDDLVGFFVNTLVLRTDLSGDPTFRELLDRVRETDLAAWSHQDLPFDRLVEAVNPERSAARHPLFQVMLSVTEAGDPAPELPGLRVASHFTSLDIAKFDLTVTFQERRDAESRPAGMDITVEYATDLYDAATIRTAAERLVRVLRTVADAPGVSCGGIDLLSDEERRQLLVDWKGAEHPPAALSLSELFAAQLARTPGAVAAVSAETGRELTYAELDDRANRLAHRLLDAGVARGSRVVLFQERSLEALVATLAVVKTGAAYVPLDTRYPIDRINLILHAAGARVFLADRDLDGLDLPPDTVALSVRGVADPPADPAPAADPGIAVHPDELAYIMFTSGSSGVPKGVTVRHRSVADLATESRFTSGAHDRVLLHSPLAFDASTYEIWRPWLSGGTVVVAPPGVLDTAALRRVFTRHAVTGLFMTTGLFRVVAEEDPAVFTGVREVWTGGDVVPPEPVRQVMERCPATTVVVVYGPTETTTFATAQPIGRPYSYPGALPIGGALDNTRLYVLDDGLRLVPPGAPGELYIAGTGLARGYLDAPVLTAAQFVADPYGPPGSRMYRTGDLVRWSRDGAVEFLGRGDQQVKLRGFRIEPGEIETALVGHESVALAVVTVREDRPGDKRLVGYVIPAEGQRVDLDALRAYAIGVLPEFMVPSDFVPLDRLPLTVNGKLDSRALPPPPRQQPQGTGRPPRSPRETVLCDLFADLLGLEKVGIDDNFFHLGGHSLLASRLVSRVRVALGVEMSVTALFDNPVVAKLSDHLDGAAGARPKLRPMRRMGANQ